MAPGRSMAQPCRAATLRRCLLTCLLGDRPGGEPDAGVEAELCENLTLGQLARWCGPCYVEVDCWIVMPLDERKVAWGRRGHPPEFRRKVLDLLEAGRTVSDLPRDPDISIQTIYTWRRQARIDRGLEPGLPSSEKAGLAAAERRIAELETELQAIQCRRPGGVMTTAHHTIDVAVRVAPSSPRRPSVVLDRPDPLLRRARWRSPHASTSPPRHNARPRSHHPSRHGMAHHERHLSERRFPGGPADHLEPGLRSIDSHNDHVGPPELHWKGRFQDRAAPAERKLGAARRIGYSAARRGVAAIWVKL